MLQPFLFIVHHFWRKKSKKKKINGKEWPVELPFHDTCKGTSQRAVVKVQLGQTCVCVSVGGDFARVPTF